MQTVTMESGQRGFFLASKITSLARVASCGGEPNPDVWPCVFSSWFVYYYLIIVPQADGESPHTQTPWPSATFRW